MFLINTYVYVASKAVDIRVNSIKNDYKRAYELHHNFLHFTCFIVSDPAVLLTDEEILGSVPGSSLGFFLVEGLVHDLYE